MNITTWRPDTCDCEIEYAWDDSIPQDGRVHTAHKINRVCPAHVAETDKVKHYETVLEENHRKNLTIDLIYQNGGKRILTLAEKQQMSLFFAVQGEGNRPVPDDVWKLGVKVDWSFDVNRSLVVDIKGLTSAEKTAIGGKLMDIATKFPEVKTDKIQIL